jgi:hypothetical protein
MTNPQTHWSFWVEAATAILMASISLFKSGGLTKNSSAPLKQQK